MAINSINSEATFEDVPFETPPLEEPYETKIQSIEKKMGQGEYLEALILIKKEVDEIKEKYSSCYRFLALSQFEATINDLKKEALSKLPIHLLLSI